MSLISWQSLQALETIYQQIQANLTNLIENSHESMIWMSTNGLDLISEIRTHETAADIVLNIQLPEQLTNLEVQVSPETAVIRARSLQDEVEGFFSSGPLENIIPLPIAVHPEAVRAEVHDAVLTLTLPKSGKIDRQRIALQLNYQLSPEILNRSMASL